MGKQTDPALQVRSLADVLAEELDGKLGEEHNQEAPVAEKQARLNAIYDRIHTEQPQRSALCLSGGGIRSAIFGLGILQGLAQKDLLRGLIISRPYPVAVMWAVGSPPGSRIMHRVQAEL